MQSTAVYQNGTALWVALSPYSPWKTTNSSLLPHGPWGRQGEFVLFRCDPPHSLVVDNRKQLFSLLTTTEWRGSHFKITAFEEVINATKTILSQILNNQRFRPMLHVFIHNTIFYNKNYFSSFPKGLWTYPIQDVSVQKGRLFKELSSFRTLALWIW